jgi:hypothetical protein
MAGISSFTTLFLAFLPGRVSSAAATSRTVAVAPTAR